MQVHSVRIEIMNKMSTGVDDKMYKKLTTQPRNVVQVYSVKVEAVSEMSTDVDSASRGHGDNAKTASEMSTGVDLINP